MTKRPPPPPAPPPRIIQMPPKPASTKKTSVEQTHTDPVKQPREPDTRSSDDQVG